MTQTATQAKTTAAPEEIKKADGSSCGTSADKSAKSGESCSTSKDSAGSCSTSAKQH